MSDPNLNRMASGKPGAVHTASSVTLARMPRSKRSRPAGKATPDLPFHSIPLRERHDGWTADRQIAFIDALAARSIFSKSGYRIRMAQEENLYSAKNERGRQAASPPPDGPS